MTTINSITKKDGEVLNVGDVTNFGTIRFFTSFTAEIYAAFQEHPNQYKVEEVSKKWVGDGFVWTDELVREFRIFCGKFSVSHEDAIPTFKKYKNGEDFLWSENKQSQPTPPQTRSEFVKEFHKLRREKPIYKPEPPKERIEVIRISSTHVDDYDCKEAWIRATLSKHPDANKLRHVRKAIEAVLNNETIKQ